MPPLKSLPSDRVIAVILANTVAGVLLDQALGLPALGLAARTGLCLLFLAGLRTATVREISLLAMALVLGGILLLRREFDILRQALDLASFFSAFIVLITLMREAAARSESLLSVGHYLTSQPPGRRYFSTALGGHFLGIFLNFGAVSLMAPLIQQSAIRPDGTPDRALERRQLSALMRGFSWILLWAPTTLSQGVLLTLFPAVHWQDLLLPGLSTAAMMIVLGRALDRLDWPRLPPTAEPPLPLPVPAAAVVAGVCIFLIFGTFSLHYTAGHSVALSLMYMAPTATLIWLLAQCARTDRAAGTAGCLRGIARLLTGAAPKLTRAAMALGLSGFIGRTAAEVLPLAELAHRYDIGALPGWLFLAGLPVLIVLGGQFALSPILVVVLLGEVMKAIPVLPAEPALIVFALSAGWALSMSASPNATATLMISASTGIAPTTLTWRWNLRYAVLCYAMLVLLFRVMT